MSDLISMEKQYRTRDGREVRIYAVEQHQVHGAFFDEATGRWQIQAWQCNGGWLVGDRHPLDLIEVKPKIKRTYWLVHWHSPIAIAQAFPTCERALDYAAGRECVSSITGPHTVEFTEGDGL